MTYVFCKKVIANKTYDTVEDMQIKLDVFLLNNRVSQEQYNELTSMLVAA